MDLGDLDDPDSATDGCDRSQPSASYRHRISGGARDTYLNGTSLAGSHRRKG